MNDFRCCPLQGVVIKLLVAGMSRKSMTKNTGRSIKNPSSQYCIQNHDTHSKLIVRIPHFGVGYNRDQENFLSNKI